MCKIDKTKTESSFRREHVLASAYDTMRERLAIEFDRKVAACGGNGADLVCDAFTYAAGHILANDLPVEARDLECLVRQKARRLARDVYRSVKRRHGRRSVKAATRLDDNADGVAYARYRVESRTLDHELLLRAQRDVVDALMERNNVTERNREIVRKVIFDGLRPQVVADEYRVARNNVDQMVGRIRRGVVNGGAAPILERYEQLEGWRPKAAAQRFHC